ncbi:MAG: hypothetical protein MJZ23_00170 [Paludibacteraceae bacterium]|nr:hypothetical protein [Paludibacteraceae bacterium]
MSTYGLLDRIPFGKHSGDTVKYIIDNDKNYYRWMVENCYDVDFTDDVYDYANGADYSKKRGDPKEDEYQRLLDICRNMDFEAPYELSEYITDNNIGRYFPHLAGDVKFDDGSTLENGIAPESYGRLCRDLGFEGPKSYKYVTNFTPNKDLY